MVQWSTHHTAAFALNKKQWSNNGNSNSNRWKRNQIMSSVPSSSIPVSWNRTGKIVPVPPRTSGGKRRKTYGCSLIIRITMRHVPRGAMVIWRAWIHQQPVTTTSRRTTFPVATPITTSITTTTTMASNNRRAPTTTITTFITINSTSVSHRLKL